jgi:hypothetical protein
MPLSDEERNLSLAEFSRAILSAVPKTDRKLIEMMYHAQYSRLDAIERANKIKENNG